MRTEYCGNVGLTHVKQEVILCGWVHSIRKLKQILFISLRDCEGIVQVVFNQDKTDIFHLAKTLRNEFCIQITGTVQPRTNNNINDSIQTGYIEILASKLIIINSSLPIPFDTKKNNKQLINLKYRYLELRNFSLLKNLKIRNDVIRITHNFMQKNKFLYIETPILTKSTPEGARDYLVPSRIHPKKFYALPQSPQLFKQLLMISGIDRYYQITKCFRDEDLRSDRQPEFTQIDIELAFVSISYIQLIIEKLLRKIWLKIKQVHLGKFKKLTFSDSMKLYGTDKPDLRNPIKIIDIKNILKTMKFKNFSFDYNDSNARIVALCIPGGSSLTIKDIQFYQLIAKKNNSKLFVIKHFDNTDIMPDVFSIEHIFTLPIIKKIVKKVGAKKLDLIFVTANKIHIVNHLCHVIRTKLAQQLTLIDERSYKPVWITDFPMFNKNHEGRLSSTHHPFVQPKNISLKELKENPIKAVSNAYDIVINGYELGGGSMRINDYITQKTVFQILGLSEQKQKDDFDFFTNALQYGAPVHSGIAIGLDRLIMLLINSHDIKDVIAFPKTTTAACLTTNAPTNIHYEQLQELHIKYIK
ncbi:MAG: aspartate--tRNA ligase [Buchnera aphidicola (Eriosoma harunire)]